jgi:hypothetical protein
MEYDTDKIERTRADVVQVEQRILRQRRRVEKMLVERHPADEAQAQLLIMEQSLISMTRFLKTLERELEIRHLGVERRPTNQHAATQQRVPEAEPDRPQSPQSVENHR